MSRFVNCVGASAIFGLSFCADLGYAHEVYLPPQCKQGICFHTTIKNIQPISFLRMGILLAYESKSIEAKCSNDGNVDLLKDPCFENKPDLGSSSEPFKTNYAFCSTHIPAHVFPVDNPITNKSTLMASFLDPAGAIYGYQTWSIASYFAVCHGLPPRHDLNEDLFKRYVVALAYKPLPERNQSEQQIEFTSVTKLLEHLNGKPALPTSWVGRWYVDNAKACRGEEGMTDGLVVYKPKEVIGLENNCKITALAAQGTKTALKMRCAGEGMTSNEQEVVEVVNGKLRRTTIPTRRGERPMVFDYSRCP